MARVTGFPPICGRAPRILILGSMPGVASLEAVQYYAHPRNAFWPLMQSLFEIDAGLPYRRRAAALKRQGVALWDVLESCVRSGSLDAAIERDSVRANDIGGFLAAHRSVRAVFFNGQMAATAYRRHVVPTLSGETARVRTVRLPSTSPANAGWSFERKLAAWRQVATFVDVSPSEL
jgi:hypoxanthine-DNA glycosylase